MQCPNCKKDHQRGQYCSMCGHDLLMEASIWQKFANRLTRKNLIIACSVVVVLFAVLMIWLFNGKTPEETVTRPVVVTNQKYPESERVKKLRNAVALDVDLQKAEDQIVGHWQHYSTGGTIDKVGTGVYRWLTDGRCFMITFKGDAYEITCDEEHFYRFHFNDVNELASEGGTSKSGKEMREPEFEEGFALSRIGQDGQPAQHIHLNTDVFELLGNSYGNIAGLYGPGALTVINGVQYVIFRGDGGNVAITFTGDTVPLAQGNKPYRLKPLTEEVKPEENKQEPQTDATKVPSEKEKEESKLEIPNPATFPGTYAVATGTLWVDLGFLVNDCPRTLSLERFSELLGVKFETGASPGNMSGYHFYGAKDGYFAATFNHGNRSYKLSGYGKNLDRAKTVVFIERR